MTSNQKLEFTQNLLNFANRIDSKSLADNLVPALQLFAQENSDIKRALLSQMLGLIILVKEQCGHDGYKQSTQVIFDLID